MRVVFDAAGNRIARTDYVPFGEALNPTGALPSEQFTGQHRDGDAGLDYFGARYYAARLGRFGTIDPVSGHPGDPQSWNRYVYARNAPGTFVDPTGMDAILPCIPSDFHFCSGVTAPGSGGGGGGGTIPNVPTLPICFAAPLACGGTGGSWIDDPEQWFCFPTCGQLTPDRGVDGPLYQPPPGGAAAEEQLASTGETGGNVTQSALQDAIDLVDVFTGGPGKVKLVSEVAEISQKTFRRSVLNNAGKTAAEAAGDHAHHMYPREFAKDWDTLKVRWNDAINGALWTAREHLSKAAEYNAEWARWLAQTVEKSAETAAVKARELAVKHGLNWP